MSAAVVLLVALQLADPQQPPPTIRVVRDAQDDITLETAGGLQRLPFATVFSIPFTPDGVLRFSTEQKQQLTVRASDLVAGDTWHLVQDFRSGALFLWASAGHITNAPIGAAVITADAAACSPAQMFRLAMLVTGESGVPIPLLSTNDVARCRWMVFGLAPGVYEASLRNADGSSGRREFRIAEGAATEVTIAPPAITVTGVISVNGKPITNGMLQFSHGYETWSVLIDEIGTYQFNTDAEGEYSLTMIRPFSRFKPIRLALPRGPNTFDWNIDDPSADSQIVIDVSGHDRTADTELDFQRDGERFASSYIPAGKDTVTRTGLPFGKYRVVARQPRGTSEWREVDLSETSPSASIRLSLARASRQITLRYADGEPVISAGFGYRPEETVPGTYSLASIPPDTQLIIWPPLGTRLCRVVPASGHIEATVFPGRPITLRFQNRSIAVDEVRISTPFDCPIPLQIFLKSPLRVGPHSADVEVLNAPPDDMLTIHTRDGVYQTTVGPDGIALIPSKR